MEKNVVYSNKGNILRIIVFSILLSGLNLSAFSQCYIKSTDQNEGYVTYYLDPELVAQTQEIGIAMSVQMIGSTYYLAITYQFARQAMPLEEKVALELKNGYILELDMYTMQGANAAGVELTLAVFNLEPEQIKYFTGSELKSVRFKTQTGKSFEIPVTSNHNVLIRQLRCFGK